MILVAILGVVNLLLGIFNLQNILKDDHISTKPIMGTIGLIVGGVFPILYGVCAFGYVFGLF